MSSRDEQDLLESAFEKLQELLSDDDTMSIRSHPIDASDAGSDAVWEISAPNDACQLLVEAFARFTPRDVDRVLGGISSRVRKLMQDPPIVVVAPWLSPRSRSVLTERGLNYIDMTGNMKLKVVRPAVRIQIDGAQHDPDPPAKAPVRLQGAGINALVRVLVDHEPPYRMVDLARASGLSYGYVSRALDALHQERLIERPLKDRVVADVDWPALLRLRADQYNLIDSNKGATFLARAGASSFYRRLEKERVDQAIVTGSFAAYEFVQVAAPAQLVLYVPSIGQFSSEFGLLPATHGANVILLRAAHRSQLTGIRSVGNTFHVGLSQLALDCLSGNGRLPEEGEELLAWMQSHVALWRHPDLSETR